MARAHTRFLAVAALAAICGSALAAPRQLASLYPSLDPAILEKARAEGGFSASAASASELRYLPAGEAGEAVLRAFGGRKFSFLVESLGLVPAWSGTGLELFNAMTRFRSLSGLTYRSHSKGEGAILFEDATRVSDLKKATALPDEAVAALPERSEHLVRLKDANFGVSYYRARIDARLPGLLFSMENARALSVFLVPVIGEGGFLCVFYVEPTEEGLLVYGVAGGSVSGLAAKQVDIPSAVRKRAAALRGWLTSASK
jgi:hypothetical protein